jgi:hypothetical protein
MAPSPFQSVVLRLLARQRRERGESYVAGGIALNALLAAPRRSRDIDLFHDTTEALHVTWAADRDAIRAAGYDVKVTRELPGFVEAIVSSDSGKTAMQWVRDSAYRFFPLVEDDLMGLALHPFDLATNKVLTIASRAEARDWIDALSCHRRLQPFGYLAWAACGKDPGYNPVSLLGYCRRRRFSQAEIDDLEYDGKPPSAAELGGTWHEALESAQSICAQLPSEHSGKCVLTDCGDLLREPPERLSDVLRAGLVSFHEGRIGGSWPTAVPVPEDE